MTTPKSYGTSVDGVELTDELIEQLADEAEAGYDVEVLKTRTRRGRPALGSAPAAALPVRLPPELRAAVAARATAEGLNESELVRKALKAYLAPAPAGKLTGKLRKRRTATRG